MHTVLVVEDHADTLEVMRRIIGSFGHRALGAHTAEAGLAMLASEKPDIIIVDGMMPGMNGTEFIRLCRANADTALIPIILHTALTDAQFNQDAIAKGANEVWHKGNVGIDQMRNRLEHYLNGFNSIGASRHRGSDVPSKNGVPPAANCSGGTFVQNM